MVIIQVAGGLGNQLQQYALYRKFVRLGVEARLDLSWFDKVHTAEKEWTRGKDIIPVVTRRELELRYFDRLVFETCTKEEKEALTNIIQLVRFANHQIETLESLYPSAQQRFNLWYGQVQRTVTESQITIIRQIVDYIASNGACTIKDIIDDDKTRAAQLIKAFGGKSQADEALASLSKFLLYRKTA